MGARDHLTPPRLAREIVGLIPGSDLVVLPDVGHQLPFEAPDSLAALIKGASAMPPMDHAEVRRVVPGTARTLGAP